LQDAILRMNSTGHGWLKIKGETMQSLNFYQISVLTLFVGMNASFIYLAQLILGVN